ncbi:MAG: hypothetical protein LH650_07340, partial [Chloroflexi bacterium]|nr:hypothetical protein [Chloroflexota bacterium]
HGGRRRGLRGPERGSPTRSAPDHAAGFPGREPTSPWHRPGRRSGRKLRRPDGAPQPGLWAIGSLRKGAEWESTAVPELRLHARDVAAAILDLR